MRLTVSKLLFLETANPQKAFEEPAGNMSGALRSFSGKPDFHAAQKSAGKQHSLYLCVSAGLSAVWGCAFLEKFKSDTPIPDKMAPGTQLVFLYLYYLKGTEDINLTRISKELQLSKATCTRAINDLTASGLLAQKVEGTNKWIAPAFEKPEFLKKGYARLKSPIERLVYVKDLPENLLCFQSGVKALSEITMVGAKEQAAGLAVSKKTCPSIPADDMISKQDFEDFGGTIIEVWSYDPSLLSKSGRVDEISLLLSLESEPDERIQMGLDEIREKHELPVKQDE
jgi:predicted DNA-binding transcriptional regulator